jgi:hypothetical protein
MKEFFNTKNLVKASFNIKKSCLSIVENHQKSHLVSLATYYLKIFRELFLKGIRQLVLGIKIKIKFCAHEYGDFIRNHYEKQLVSLKVFRRCPRSAQRTSFFRRRSSPGENFRSRPSASSLRLAGFTG